MSKFKVNDFQVKAAGDAKPDEVRVVKDAQASREVRTFEFEKLRGPAARTAATRSKFAATAEGGGGASRAVQKDKRFALHDLVREHLSVEDEERRAIEERVQARLAVLQEQARAEAERRGYADGLKKGHDEAFREFQQEGAVRLERLDALLSEAETAKDAIFRANERFLLELIYRIGRMIVLKEVSADKDYLLRLAREIIERIGVRENITIRIHPDDKESLGMLREGLEQALGGLRNLNIETSNQVNRGGCTVETEWNAIDASIETQLQGVYTALLGQERGT